ncbi:hypothetical protein EMIT0P260_20452 [Pseudomonas sp. IT-P260]
MTELLKFPPSLVRVIRYKSYAKVSDLSTGGYKEARGPTGPRASSQPSKKTCCPVIY